jgi:Bcr/CflA subfamily drug resistance transporter
VTAPSHRSLALVLGALAAMGPFSVDMYLPAFPALGESLGAAPGAVQATLAVYFLGMAAGQVFYGPVADRFGRRGPLFIGLGLFTVASVLCALAPDIGWLTGARLAQALGGCAGMVIARAVVRDVTDERGAVRLMASLMLVMGVAPIVAPIIGGALLPVFGWRGIFALLALYGVAMIVVIALALPETLPPDRRRRDGVAATLASWAMRWRAASSSGGCSPTSQARPSCSWNCTACCRSITASISARMPSASSWRGRRPRAWRSGWSRRGCCPWRCMWRWRRGSRCWRWS